MTLCAFHAQAQWPDKLKHGLKTYLDKNDSSSFIQLQMVGQFWIRNTQNNPYSAILSNSAGASGTPPAQYTAESNTTDMSIRRIRFVLSGALTDRLNFFIQFGQNNLNYLTPRKAQSFFHDITVDYAVIKKKLSIGTGLNGWNGPSRYSNTLVGSILALDPPNYQEVTNDTYDQFVRRLGVYAKGKLGKFDYRASVGKPFVIATASGSGTEAINVNATFSTLPPKLVYQGYFMYQFLDQESNFGPGAPGSYLGKKKVFNIGTGFYYQQNAMFRHSSASSTDTVKQDMKLFSLDVFYDAPINKETGTAISVYSCFSHYDYGTNFIKVSGPDNPASATTLPKTASSFEKSNYGNAFPYLGTGNIEYIQAAYKFKNNLLGEQGTIQPFVDLQYSKYDRLQDAMCVYDIGLNWLIHGNNSKITLNYQNRPYFAPNASGALVENSRLGEWVIQYHVAF